MIIRNTSFRRNIILICLYWHRHCFILLSLVYMNLNIKGALARLDRPKMHFSNSVDNTIITNFRRENQEAGAIQWPESGIQVPEGAQAAGIQWPEIQVPEGIDDRVEVPLPIEDEERSDTNPMSESVNFSSHPSARPSYMPSDLPSYQPSHTPSFLPSVSLLPSDVPSFLPSDLPSLMPSVSPSFLPSYQPSNLPSDLPSDQPSFAPTNKPSSLPSDQPSSIPSVGPSSLPTSHPSSEPTSQPSSVPSLSSGPSETPSSGPSASAYPSLTPSQSPTAAPSATPTSSPTATPSRQPSSKPSARPSVSPSSQPSLTPSRSPTGTPSVSPSVQPSSAPTPVCHDNPYYRSPLNNFLCQDHQGTPCIQWRFLGLSLEQVEELITNCPESCQIDCGLNNPFEVTISYQISGVSGLLDSTTVERIHEVGVEYLTDFVSLTVPDSIFFVDNALLISQNELPAFRRSLSEAHVRSRPVVTRVLQEGVVQSENVNLRLIIRFQGFAIRINPEIASQHVLRAVRSPGYQTSIRSSGDPELISVSVFDVIIEDERTDRIPQAETPNEESSGAATFAPTFAALIFVIAIGVASYFHHRRTGRWLPGKFGEKRETVLIREKSLSVASPEQNLGSPVGSYFSFDDNATGETGAGGPSMLRFIGSISRSRDSTSPNSSTIKSQDTLAEDDYKMEEGGVESHDNKDEEHGDEENVEEEEEEQEEEEEEEEHPLASIIPPMIVIGNIDDEENANDTDEESEDAMERIRLGHALVPTKHVDASNEFIAVLNKRRKPCSPSKFAGFLHDTGNYDTEQGDTAWDQARRPSPMGIVVDSDDEDDASVASTPVRTQDLDFTTPLRKTKSFGDDVSEVDNSPESLRLQSLASGYVNLNTEVQLDEVGEVDLSRISDLSSPRKEGDFDAYNMIDIISEVDRDILEENTPRKSTDGIIQQLWSLSPMAKGMIKKDTTKSKRASTPTRSDSLRSTPIKSDMVRAASTPTMVDVLAKLTPTPKRPDSSSKVASSVIPQAKIVEEEVTFEEEYFEPRLTSTSNSVRNSSHSSEEIESYIDEFHEFHAPRKGKLGLVIDSNLRMGPIVNMVKDYSPLFGCIHAGDRIVEVDGLDTSQMTGDQVARIVNAKPNRRGSGDMRIIKIARPIARGRDHEGARFSPKRFHSSERSYSSSRNSSSSQQRIKEEDKEAGVGVARDAALSDPLLDFVDQYDPRFGFLIDRPVGDNDDEDDDHRSW